jgi:hypothetical protein
MIDRRDNERVPILGDLHAEIVVFQPMLIRDISIGGITIESRYPLQLNSLHDIRLILGSTSVIVKGRVVHSRISDVDQDIVTYRSGVEFVDPPEHASAAVAEYVQELKANRSAAQSRPTASS